MNAAEILHSLHRGHPGSKGARAHLWSLLDGLSKGRVRNQYGASLVISERLREDVVHDVWEHFVNLGNAGPLGGAPTSVSACRQYCASSLTNRALDLMEGAEAPPPGDGGGQGLEDWTTGGIVGPPDPEGTWQEGVKRRLGYVQQEAVKRRRRRDRRHLEQAWAEAQRVLDGESGPSILGVRPIPGAAKRPPALVNYYQRQHRLREALGCAIEGLQAEGVISEHDAEAYWDDLTKLPRRRVSRSRADRPGAQGWPAAGGKRGATAKGEAGKRSRR